MTKTSATMRAVRVRRYGGSEELVLDEAPVPEPGEGEVLVRLAYAGINFIDVYMRQGVYRHSHTYANTPPFTPGMEGAGWVERTGPGVDGPEPGTPVGYCLTLGSYAEYAVVPAWRLVTIPDGIDLGVGTALMLQGCTAHYLTHSLFHLESGQTCLVHAGAGGVGQLLIQIARIRGARVIATVGSEEKAEIARGMGAEVAILYREVDFDDAVLEATNGMGVDVVYDSVGQATFKRSLRALARRGTCALFGGSSGAVKSVNPLDLAEAGSVFLSRPHLADYTADATEIQRRADDLFGWVAAGRLKVAIDEELPLAEARAAHDAIEGRQTKGKLLLRSSPK
jgi:NADPH2:quinone reductase